MITCSIQGVTKASIFFRNLLDSQGRAQGSRSSYLLQRPERTHLLIAYLDIYNVPFSALSLATPPFFPPLRIVTPLVTLIFHDRSGVMCLCFRVGALSRSRSMMFIV